MDEYFPTAASSPTHTIFPGVNISTYWGEKMMFSVVELDQGAVVEEHEHPHEQMGLLLEGEAVFTIGGKERTLQPGDRYVIPGNTKHRVVALKPTKALDAFCPVREEYK